MEKEIQRENSKTRINWIDYLKAIGIFLVVLGHSNPLTYIRKYIYSFHMPLFFIVSGLTFNPGKYDSTKMFIKHKAKTILLPYLMINLFTIPFYLYYFKILNFTSVTILDIIKGIFIANNDIIVLVNGPTWFLPTLFLTDVLVYIIYRKFKDNKNNIFIISILLLLIGYVESITSGDIIMPWHLNSIPVCTFFTLIGFLCKDYIKVQDRKQKVTKIIYGIIFILAGAIIAVKFNGSVSFGGNNYKSILLTISSIVLTMLGFSIILMRIKCKNIITDLWSFIGKNTLIILGLHKIIIFIFRYFIPEFKKVSLESTILGVIIFVICIPLTWFIRKFVPFMVGQFKNYNLVNKILLCFCIIFIICFGIFYYNYFNISEYKNLVQVSTYMAHALGGIDGQTYTNSREAIENTYNKGIRLFEVDVEFTSDDKLVCVHGWNKEDYEERLGITYNEENSVMTYEQFLNSKIKYKYDTMSFEDLVKYMEKYNDIYVMIDIGKKSYEDTKKIYTEILNTTKDKNILNRMITGGHTTDMIKAVKEVYEFKLINLYWSGDKLEKGINTQERFAKYCLNNNITSLSMAKAEYSKELIQYFKNKNLIIYVFTENDIVKAKEMLSMGVDIVGTDFLI